MLQQQNSATEKTCGAVYRQRFSVPYEYQVWFTEKLFAPDNPILRDALCRLEPDKKHRCLVIIDDGVSAARVVEAVIARANWDPGSRRRWNRIPDLPASAR